MWLGLGRTRLDSKVSFFKVHLSSLHSDTFIKLIGTINLVLEEVRYRCHCLTCDPSTVFDDEKSKLLIFLCRQTGPKASISTQYLQGASMLYNTYIMCLLQQLSVLQCHTRQNISLLIFFYLKNKNYFDDEMLLLPLK